MLRIVSGEYFYGRSFGANEGTSIYWFFMQIRALLEFMTTPQENLKRRAYNVTAMSFTPEELVAELAKYVPELRVTYKPDSRQLIGNIEPHNLIHKFCHQPLNNYL